MLYYNYKKSSQFIVNFFLNKKLIKLKKKESDKRRQKEYIEQINVLFPEIEEKYGLNIFLKKLVYLLELKFTEPKR